MYARLTITQRIFFGSTHLLHGLALKQQLLFLFGFFVASMFVSRCIQTFISASRRCRFHCRQPLCHSLSPFADFVRLLLLHPLSPCHSVVYFNFLSQLSACSRFVVPSLASHSFTSAHCRPDTRLLQLFIANVDLSSS